ncbi:Non-specific serine/threonine protein kinase [Aphelenchoides fujianensis]|nr:Non-specific serine/threonine protein kinase [Aphelenchoides fujianensis]
MAALRMEEDGRGDADGSPEILNEGEEFPSIFFLFTQVDRSFPYSSDRQLISQGAEARVFKCVFLGRPAVLKERFVKNYRHPELDRRLTKERIRNEARAILKCKQVERVCFIDFGLSGNRRTSEDFGVDLYVLERAIRTTHVDLEFLMDEILAGYASVQWKGAKDALNKLAEVRTRGRKREMIG